MGNQPSQPKITAQDKAIYQLKRQRDSLKQYQRKLNVVIDKQTQFARQAITDGKPDKAKMYLRLKKQQQSLVNSTYDQLGNLEGLIGTIEFKLIEKDVLYGLQQGNEVLKKLNSEMSVEKIDKVMDDLEDERIKVDEVSDMLGAGLTNLEEQEVDEELQQLEDEVLGREPAMPDVPTRVEPELPDVPTRIEPELPSVPQAAPHEQEPQESQESQRGQESGERDQERHEERAEPLAA